jgi:hypothetical protein
VWVIAFVRLLFPMQEKEKLRMKEILLAYKETNGNATRTTNRKKI